MDTRTSESSRSSPGEFPATRWSLVLAAGETDAPNAGVAMESICQIYWLPLYRYARRVGHSEHDAQDLTQGFFLKMLEARWLNSADRERGKLRAFLITVFKRYMANEWRRAQAQRRGGSAKVFPIDTSFAERTPVDDGARNLSADDTYEREWALTLLNRSVDRLRSECEASGRPDDFEALKDALPSVRAAIDYRVAAERLGTNEGAARVAVHRFRKRFRAVFREEVSRTLADGEDLDTEMRRLAEALARRVS